MYNWELKAHLGNFVSPKQMFETLQSHMTQEQLASRFGCARSTIQCALKKYKVQPKKKGLQNRARIWLTDNTSCDTRDYYLHELTSLMGYSDKRNCGRALKQLGLTYKKIRHQVKKAPSRQKTP